MTPPVNTRLLEQIAVKEAQQPSNIDTPKEPKPAAPRSASNPTTQRQRYAVGTAGGGALGLLMGYLAGHQKKQLLLDTLLGAGIGAGGAYALGEYVTSQEGKRKNAMSLSDKVEAGNEATLDSMSSVPRILVGKKVEKKRGRDASLGNTAAYGLDRLGVAGEVASAGVGSAKLLRRIMHGTNLPDDVAQSVANARMNAIYGTAQNIADYHNKDTSQRYDAFIKANTEALDDILKMNRTDLDATVDKWVAGGNLSSNIADSVKNMLDDFRSAPGTTVQEKLQNTRDAQNFLRAHNQALTPAQQDKGHARIEAEPNSHLTGPQQNVKRAEQGAKAREFLGQVIQSYGEVNKNYLNAQLKALNINPTDLDAEGLMRMPRADRVRTVMAYSRSLGNTPQQTARIARFFNNIEDDGIYHSLVGVNQQDLEDISPPSERRILKDNYAKARTGVPIAKDPNAPNINLGKLNAASLEAVAEQPWYRRYLGIGPKGEKWVGDRPTSRHKPVSRALKYVDDSSGTAIALAYIASRALRAGASWLDGATSTPTSEFQSPYE